MNSANYFKISSYINQFTKIYNEKKRDFPLDIEKLKNMINNWKSKSNKFNKYTIFENNIIDGNNHILRVYNYYLFFTEKNKTIKTGEYAIWVDDNAIAHMRQSEHYQFDSTWYKPTGFSQILIGLYRDPITFEKYPGCYIIMNYKFENIYIKIFQAIKNILTQDNILELKLKYLTTDGEIALYI